MSFQYVPLTGESPPRQPAPKNRRASVRYQCGLATPGRVLAEGQECQRAWILDLSQGGVGLLLSRPLEAGSKVMIVVKSSNSDKTFELVGHICHSSRQADGDWIVGCEFEKKLAVEALDELL
jgi:hypothetical protein